MYIYMYIQIYIYIHMYIYKYIYTWITSSGFQGLIAIRIGPANV